MALRFVVKVFSKPFDLEGNFIKELAGFEALSTVQGKNFHLVTTKAIGTCMIDGKKYGLLVISYASGTNMQDLVIQINLKPKESKERENALHAATKAFEKLGIALAELHQNRAQKDVSLHPVIIQQATNGLKQTIEGLEHNDHGIDIERLQDYFNSLVQRMEKERTTRSFIHGDAHLGNFLYKEETDTISIVDYGELWGTVDQEGTVMVGKNWTEKSEK